jgi:hypothetical protein
MDPAGSLASKKGEFVYALGTAGNFAFPDKACD